MDYSFAFEYDFFSAESIVCDSLQKTVFLSGRLRISVAVQMCWKSEKTVFIRAKTRVDFSGFQSKVSAGST
jgi:hypothetical protein